MLECVRLKATNLLENQNLVGCLEVLQLVGDQDARLVPQHAADAPGDVEMTESHFDVDSNDWPDL